MDIKENLAKNLTIYRKAKNLTQAELAEKLNYSDKAVSKWERGESVPDLSVLKQLADFYDVSIDILIENPGKSVLNSKKLSAKRFTAINLFSTGLVWLIAVLCFAIINLIFPPANYVWIVFIYAIPITSILLIIFSAIWKRLLIITISISSLLWSTLLSIFLTLNLSLDNSPQNLWMLFLIGIPLQALTLIFFIYKKSR